MEVKGLPGRLPGGGDAMHKIWENNWIFFPAWEGKAVWGKSMGGLRLLHLSVQSVRAVCYVGCAKRWIQGCKHSSCALNYGAGR